MHGMNSNKTYTSNETNIYTSYTNEVMPQHILHMICMKKHIILFVLNFFSLDNHQWKSYFVKYLENILVSFIMFPIVTICRFYISINKIIKLTK